MAIVDDDRENSGYIAQTTIYLLSVTQRSYFLEKNKPSITLLHLFESSLQSTMALELSRSLRLFLFIATAIPLYAAASLTTLRQQQPPGVSIKLWCVAKNNADDSALQSAIDWACGTGGADCTPIQQGGPCYDPADIRRTASYAFNDYCTKNGMTEDTCNFANTAALTSLDPSHSHCKFPSSLEGKSGEGTGTGTVKGGGGGSTADLTSRGGIINVACGIWFWSFLVIIHFFWLIVV